MIPENIQIEVLADEPAAAAACGQYLAQQLSLAIAERGQASFAVSGGTSPKAMFHLLAQEPVDWNAVHMFWVDERCVPPEDEASNYGMTKAALLDRVGIPESNVHRVRTELEPTEAAIDYSATVKEVLGREMRFDVMHRGLGPDAHTASLFPGDRLIEHGDGVAAAVWAEHFSQWRVTLVPRMLRQARATALYVPGADKAEAVARILIGELAPLAVPAQITARFGVPEAWFLDQASASKLAL